MAAVKGIAVTVVPPTARGRLYPRYRNSIGILALDPRQLRDCPHGVNIDGTLILDFDENRILAGVELMAPMSRWKGRMPVDRPRSRPGDIRLAERSSSFHDWRVIVSRDVQRDMAVIAFGGCDYDLAVGLSENASALLRDDHLVGFWFSLAHPPY